jgi:HEAT repeat protein
MKTKKHGSANDGNRQRRMLFVAAASLVGIGLLAWYTMSPEDPVAILARELQSDDVEQRYDAAKSLEQLGPNALLAVNELSNALSDDELKVRYRAAKALSRMGPPAAAAVPSLAVALQDPERDVRYYAAKALYKIDNDAAPALQPVIQVLDNGESDPDVRRYLVKTLAEIGEDSEEAHRVAKKLERDPDARVREEVKEMLAAFKQTE